jgi:hypothetical protein
MPDRGLNPRVERQNRYKKHIMRGEFNTIGQNTEKGRVNTTNPPEADQSQILQIIQYPAHSSRVIPVKTAVFKRQNPPTGSKYPGFFIMDPRLRGDEG